jgi:hypothetical protein
LRFPAELAAAVLAAERVLEDAGERWRIARRADVFGSGNAPNGNLPRSPESIPEMQTMVRTSIASEILNKSPERVRQLARAGVIAGERTPEGWLLDEESVHAYAKQAAAA